MSFLSHLPPAPGPVPPTNHGVQGRRTFAELEEAINWTADVILNRSVGPPPRYANMLRYYPTPSGTIGVIYCPTVCLATEARVPFCDGCIDEEAVLCFALARSFILNWKKQREALPRTNQWFLDCMATPDKQKQTTSDIVDAVRYYLHRAQSKGKYNLWRCWIELDKICRSNILGIIHLLCDSI